MSTACYSKSLNRLLNGKPTVLIKDGVPQQRNLRRSKVSETLLEENMRLEARVSDLAQVRDANLERSGKMSILTAGGEPKVVEV